MSDLAQGTNALSVKVVDAAGNWNETSISFFVDTIAPSISISSPGAGAWYNTTTLNITWSASDGGSGIAYYLVFLDGSPIIDVTTSYYELSGLTEGQHEVTVEAFDDAGNHENSTKTFNIELTAPCLKIVTPTDEENLNVSSVMISWTNSSASGISEVWAYMDGRGSTTGKLVVHEGAL